MKLYQGLVKPEVKGPPGRGRGGKRVFFSSIRGFKGLESPVVILCELGDLSIRNPATTRSMSACRGRATTA